MYFNEMSKISLRMHKFVLLFYIYDAAILLSFAVLSFCTLLSVVFASATQQSHDDIPDYITKADQKSVQKYLLQCVKIK